MVRMVRSLADRTFQPRSSTWKELTPDGLVEVPQSIFVACVYNSTFQDQLFPAKVSMDSSSCGPRPPWLPCSIGFSRTDVAESGRLACGRAELRALKKAAR